jgi:aryl-alcohol dehydrogenase-like predicted oxidoreductase
MNYRFLGNSKISVSEICIGALHFGVYLSEEESLSLLDFGFDSGINFIDTGPLYGNGLSEGYVGKFITKRRDQVVISTKAGLSKIERPDGSFGVSLQKLNEEGIRKNLDKSLKSLNTDYIDIFQFHAYDHSLDVVYKLIDEEKIRAFGASNYSPVELKSVIDSFDLAYKKYFVALESHVNIIERRVEAELLPLCKKNNISILPYRALARGVLSGKYLSSTEFPIGSRASDSWRVRNSIDEDSLKILKVMSKFAEQKRIKVLDIAIAWLLKNKCIGSLVIGARNKNQLRECIQSTEIKLSDSDLMELDALIIESGHMNRIYSNPSVFFEQ